MFYVAHSDHEIVVEWKEHFVAFQVKFIKSFSFYLFFKLIYFVIIASSIVATW